MLIAYLNYMIATVKIKRSKCKKKIVHTRCKTCKKRSKQPMQSLKDKFPNTNKICNDDINEFLLLLSKGVYPNEYMDRWERFNEEQLPSIEKFYSLLNLKHNITKDDYKHAQKVWNTFNIRNLGKYHDLYVQSDTLQLADVFEKFRNLCLKEYKLDSAYFVTTPGLAMEACLKMAGVKLELLTDINMLLMFEKGIRGGLAQAIHRYATANNKYMPNYNKDLRSLFLMHLDANNLYGWAMSKKLPIGGCMWAKNLNIYTADFIKNYDENSILGYLLEIDVEYPKDLHELHSYLPFLPEKKDKLLATLENKERYVVQMSTLKQVLNHGLILNKKHRVIKFRQEAWLKPYIDKNTELRTNAKNEFEKDFFKLMNNAVFAKMMGNVRNHRDIKLIVTEQRSKKLTKLLQKT